MQVLSATTQDWRGRAETALADGPVCVRHALSPALLAVLRAQADEPDGWRRAEADGARLYTKPADPEALAALGGLGLGTPIASWLVRHEPGDHGVPPLPSDGRGFVIDLVDLPRAEDGGLMLFVDAEGRASGRRAEAGALALFDAAAPPLRTLLSPRAPGPLLSVVGTFAPSA